MMININLKTSEYEIALTESDYKLEYLELSQKMVTTISMFLASIIHTTFKEVGLAGQLQVAEEVYHMITKTINKLGDSDEELGEL